MRPEGWAWVDSPSLRDHYFRNGVSLCQQWESNMNRVFLADDDPALARSKHRKCLAKRERERRNATQ